MFPLDVGASMTPSLVTGAGGFVGPHLCAHLRAEGDEVIGVDGSDGPDLLDRDGWFSLLADRRPAVVYHLAGWSDVGASWRSPHTALRVNAEGTRNVLDASAAAGVGRVVVVSSAEVYTRTADPRPKSESEPIRPATPYGASKVAAEVAAIQVHDAGEVETVIARPFNHIGPGQSTNFAAPAFADRVVAAERAGGGVVRHGDLTARRDLTDVRDVVRAYRLLALHAPAGEAYNICRGDAVAMADVLGWLTDHATAEVTTEVDEALLRPVEIPVVVGDPTRLHAATGWKPRIDLDDSLTDILADARQRAEIRD